VEYRATRNYHTKHFLQAKRLGTKLHIVVFPLVALAKLELHRQQRAVRVLFHNVAFAGEAESLGEHWQSAQEGDALGDFVTGKVRVLVDDVTTQCVMIILKDALDVNQASTPGAK
jgi:hypothetical protein